MAEWFEFNGVLSTTLGVYMLEPPPITIPAERVQTLQVPGRDGDLEIPDGALEPMTLSVICYTRDVTRLSDIAKWLRGRGWLRLGNRPNERYKARSVLQVQMDKVTRGRENRTFEVLFDCQPYRYVYPEVADAVGTSSPMTINNLGNAPSEPRIKIEGSGDIVMSVGGQLMEFQGVSGGVIVDTEMMDCFNLAMSGLLNHIAAIDAFPVLRPGANVITWTGNVSRVTVTPRRRNI